MQRPRLLVWPYMLLGVALLGALSFGWYQTRLKNQLALDAENKYMSAFHNLKWTSENIEERTARLMATNDPKLQESLLADIRVFSAQAVDHMSVLPLITMNTPRIQTFLNTLRDKSDEYNYKLNLGTSLSPEDWAQLAELRSQSVFFEDQLANVLGLVGNNLIRWRDTVKVTSPTMKENGTTPITRSVMDLDQALKAPPGEEKAEAPEAAPIAPPRVDPGPPVSEAQAVAAIKKFVDMPLKGEPKLTGKTDPNDRSHVLSLYFYDAQKANGLAVSFGVSIHGGHVIFMMDGRPVTKKQLTKEDLVVRARQFLRKWGFESTGYVSAAENDGTLVMDFAPIEQGVAVHTDIIKVSLAMDNGELVGYDARSYWVNHHQRALATPKLSAREAIQRLAPRLKAEGGPRLAVVADRRGKERLCWEIRAGLDDQRYMVFVDALSGMEVNLLRIAGDPTPPMNEG